MDKIILKQSLRFQNSYRLESKNPFNHDLVKIILQRIMDKHFKQVEQIDNKTTAILCQNVTNDVIEKVKMCNFDRYKIIVVVSAIEKFMQDVNYSAKHLWDADKDSNVVCTFVGPNFTAVGIVYAIYCE